MVMKNICWLCELFLSCFATLCQILNHTTNYDYYPHHAKAVCEAESEQNLTGADYSWQHNSPWNPPNKPPEWPADAETKPGLGLTGWTLLTFPPAPLQRHCLLSHHPPQPAPAFHSELGTRVIVIAGHQMRFTGNAEKPAGYTKRLPQRFIPKSRVHNEATVQEQINMLSEWG